MFEQIKSYPGEEIQPTCNAKYNQHALIIITKEYSCKFSGLLSNPFLFLSTNILKSLDVLWLQG